MSTTTAEWTSDEMMSVAAARALTGATTCFVGIGLPSTAANLARKVHQPDPAPQPLPSHDRRLGPRVVVA